MKKMTLITAGAMFAASLVLGSAAHAATSTPGGACATAGATTTISGKSYSCVKALSGKLVWTLKSSTTVGGGAKPSIAGGAGGRDGGPGDEGSTADIARHAAMQKYSDCLVAHGGTAMTLGGPGGPGGFRGGPDDQNGMQGMQGMQNGQPNPQRSFSFPTPSAAQQKAMTACATLAPKFGGPGMGGFGGHRGFNNPNGATPNGVQPSATPSAKQ